MNAAIKGAIAGGAKTIVVSDSHGSGENILIEQLPSDVKLVRGLTRPLCMMQGIESQKFDGAIFIGYHSSANFEHGTYTLIWCNRNDQITEDDMEIYWRSTFLL